MRKRLLDAFQLTADPQANEEKRKLILNYLKMGITIPANADCRIGTKRDNLFSKSFSPLGLACNRGWADVVEQLLSRDPSRLPDERLQRVADAELNLALRQPKLDVNVITALIGGGANIFKSDIHGDTPFDNLVRYNREREKVKAILKMMIETGKLDPNIQHKNRPLFALLQKDTVGEFLLEQAAKGKSALLLAVRTPDCLKMIQTWCKSHPDAVITDRGREGKSVLAIAKSDNPEVIPYLENLMVLRLKNDPSLIEHLTSDMLERALQIAEGSKDAALVKALKQAQSNRNAEKG
jgi:ankyrin repeat protein